MVKCHNCGCICRDDDLDEHRWRESRGEFWGSPCSEEMVEYLCPECGSDNIGDYIEDDEDNEES